jgi:2-phosphosulfolactate phosphatase
VQSRSRIRLEWGPAGAQLLGPAVTVSVVVDVLSFTTTLSVAVDRGITVHPYPWDDDSAERFAAAVGATLAVSRKDAGPAQVSLAPTSVRSATRLDRLVLPSPNGSTISAALAAAGCVVLGASLRNRLAVAHAVADVLSAEPASSVAVVPAGERWPDGSLRPAVEDFWGAGGVVAALEDLGHASVSEEARAAATAYRLVEGRVGEALASCSSGRELIDGGYAGDVTIAAELDSSRSVPRLVDGAFVDGRATEGTQ